MSLYSLSDHDGSVDIQRPKRLEVRTTDGDRTVAVVEEREDGSLLVTVAAGVSIDTAPIL